MTSLSARVRDTHPAKAKGVPYAMKIINKTKDTVLAENVVLADTPFKRMKGLLGRREFNKGRALIIKPCNAIHTFFMRFPIDALFLNKENRVVGLVSDLPPWKITRLYFNSSTVIELPAGTIESTQAAVGDTISLIFPDALHNSLQLK
jgi:uncharacterized membrane protein (UPF0127 family)